MKSALVLAALSILPSATGRASTCLIADSAMGPIRLGMTLAEARRAAGTAAFVRTSDGDGAPWFESLWLRTCP